MLSMEDSKIKPVHILLPVCVELKPDIFINFIQDTILRLRLDAHYLGNAFKFGMSSEQFSIESDDLAMNWNELTTKDQQIRQSQLLGYWAFVPYIRMVLWGTICFNSRSFFDMFSCRFT